MEKGKTVLQVKGTKLTNRTGEIIEIGEGDKAGRVLIHWKTGDFIYERKIIKSWAAIANLKAI